MKILVVSLLRLGDLVMQAPALTTLKKRFPSSEIHLLTNESNKNIVPLLPAIDKVHYFPRNLLQKSLCDAEAPSVWAYNKLNDFVACLNQENFYLKVNLTHNWLSGHVMSLINSDESLGLQLYDNGVAQFGSPWFRYLNNISSVYTGPQFHWSDIYQMGCGAEERTDTRLTATSTGEAEARDILKLIPINKKIIVFQIFSSDVKKNWALTNWLALAGRLFELQKDSHIVFLGAPNEKEQLLQLANSRPELNITVATPGLEGAYSFLNKSHLLVTVDTSIKHIASATQTAIIELVLGSSQFQSTGAAQDGAILIRSKQKCAPCKHSSPCSQVRHECAFDINPELVAQIAMQKMNGQKVNITDLADAYLNTVEIFLTRASGLGYIQFEKINDSNDFVNRAVQLTAWYHLLEGKNKIESPTYGSISYKLFQKLALNGFTFKDDQIFENEKSINQKRNVVSNLKAFVERSSRKELGGDKKAFREQLLKKINDVENDLREGPLFSSLITDCNVDNFNLTRSVLSQANDCLALYDFQNRILRSFDDYLEV